MGLDLVMDDYGFWLNTNTTPGYAVRAESSLASTSSRHVEWHAVKRLEASDPWPGFRVVTPDEDRTYHPRRLSVFEPDEDALADFANLAEYLILTGLRRRPETTERGWLAVDHVHWEPVKELPKDSADRGRGAYRSASVPVLARRARPGPLSVLLQWLASRPERPWLKTTRAAAVTPHHLYAEHWNGSRWRIPIETLRARLTNEYADQVWVFGRRSFLVLPHEEGCEVTALLERRLASGLGTILSRGRG